MFCMSDLREACKFCHSGDQFCSQFWGYVNKFFPILTTGLFPKILDKALSRWNVYLTSPFSFHLNHDAQRNLTDAFPVTINLRCLFDLFLRKRKCTCSTTCSTSVRLKKSFVLLDESSEISSSAHPYQHSNGKYEPTSATGNFKA